MKKRHIFMAVIAAVILVLAVYLIIFKSQWNTMERLERLEHENIAELSRLVGIPEWDIYRAIYRPEIDYADEIRRLGLTDDTLKEALEIVNYLRNELYYKIEEVGVKAVENAFDKTGGMRIVMEVNLTYLIDNLARKKDYQFEYLITKLDFLNNNSDDDFFRNLTRVFHEEDIPLNLYFGDINDSDKKIIDFLKKEAYDAVNLSLEIIRNRIYQFGFSKVSVQKRGNNRILFLLSDVQDPTRTRNLIGRTALLEFKLLAEPDKTQKILSQIDRFLADEAKRKTPGFEEYEAETFSDSADSAAVTASTELDTAAITAAESDTSLLVDADMMEEHPFYTLLRNFERDIGVPEQNYTLVNRIIHRREIKELIPYEYEFLWSDKAKPGPDGIKYYRLYYLKKEPELTGAYLRDAQVQIGGGSSPTTAGQPIVALEMNRQGARVFSRVTGENVGEFLAIVFDNKVHMAPRIKTKIPDGRAIIEGAYDMDEARDLAIVLRAGALPAPLKIVEEIIVEP